MSWQRLTRLHAGVNRIIFHDTYGNSHIAGLFANLRVNLMFSEICAGWLEI